jgi:hypothetical protein
MAMTPVRAFRPNTGMNATARISSGMARRTLNTWRVRKATQRGTRFSAARKARGMATSVASTVPSQAIAMDSHMAASSPGSADQSGSRNISHRIRANAGTASSSRLKRMSALRPQASRPTTTSVTVQRKTSMPFSGRTAVSTRSLVEDGSPPGGESGSVRVVRLTPASDETSATAARPRR